MKRDASDKIITLTAYSVLSAFALFCLYPLLLSVMVSFSDERTVQLHGFKLFPEKLSVQTYLYLWDKAGDKILNAYTVSLLVTVVGTLAAMLVTSMMAYAMSQNYVRYRNIIALYSYFTVVFSAGIVPWYIVCVNILHVQNTFLALFVPYLVLQR